MATNPPILLIDTNIWLDHYVPQRPGYETSAAFFQEALARDAAIAYPAQAALDVYQRVRADYKKWLRESRELTQTDAIAIKRIAWDCVNEMRKIATAVPVDTNDIALACSFRDEHDDFEDTLVMAACQRSHANYLVTRDTSLAKHAPIEAKTPEEMTELLRTGRAEGSPPQSDRSSTQWLYRWLEKYGREETEA